MARPPLQRVHARARRGLACSQRRALHILRAEGDASDSPPADKGEDDATGELDPTKLRSNFGSFFEVASACVDTIYAKDPRRVAALEGVHILFVSECNIGRSVVAESILRAKLEENGLAGEVHCQSKGTVDHCAGEGPDPKIIEECAKRDIVLPEGFQARKMSVEQDVAENDLIICFDKYTCADTLREVCIYDVMQKTSTFSPKVRLLGNFHPVKKHLETKLNPEAHDIYDALYGYLPVDEVLPGVVTEIEEACEGLVQALLVLRAEAEEAGRPLKEVVGESVARMEELKWLMPPMLSERR